MRMVPRVLRRMVNVALVTLPLAFAFVAVPLTGEVSVARADDEAPLKTGATLVARGDCELQKVTLARGDRVQVTAMTKSTADIALPDGYVLRRVPMNRLRYFFEVEH